MLQSTLIITLQHDHPLDKTDARAIVGALNEDEFISLTVGDTVAGVHGGRVSVQTLNMEVDEGVEDEEDEDEDEEDYEEDEEDDEEDEDDDY